MNDQKLHSIHLIIEKGYSPVGRSLELEHPLFNRFKEAKVVGFIGEAYTEHIRDDEGNPRLGNTVIECLVDDLSPSLEIIKTFVKEKGFVFNSRISYNDDAGKAIVLKL